MLTGASMQTKLPTINQMAFSAPPGVTAGKMKPGTHQNFMKLPRGRESRTTHLPAAVVRHAMMPMVLSESLATLLSRGIKSQRLAR